MSMTLDKACLQTAAMHHNYAMKDADAADAWTNRGRLDLAISFLLSAATKESQAAQSISMMSTPHEPSRSVFYRSAASLAHEASVVLAKLGLKGSPDTMLKTELEELAQ